MENSVSDTAPRRFKKGWMNMVVKEVVVDTHDTHTFILEDNEDTGRVFDYVPGQYLTFRFDDIGPKPIVRSYTMSSSPNQGNFSAFTVKRVEGGIVSNWLCDQVKPGMILRARGPIGKFCYNPATDKKHLFMVAGGSGVTPFLSIMREFADKLGQPGAPEKMTLYVSYRSKEDLIGWPDLQAFNQNKGTRAIVTLSREDASAEGFWHGRIDHAGLTKAIAGAYGDATFMTCGPTAIMNLTVEHLKEHGVPEEHIKLESFES
jgi:ring-1,2-phenylacetyl-CoA epoxidase subunit PaaE